MDVLTYKKIFCDDNQAEFARLFGRSRQNVQYIFNNPKKWDVIIGGNKDYLAEIKAERIT